jgi:predicted N-formylglutamate amidohydrolase
MPPLDRPSGWRGPRRFTCPSTHALHAEIARRIALGRPPVIVTIHSFTPVYFGKKRAVEFGVIHDADPSYALAVVQAAKAAGGLKTELNEPYSAADQVTHTLAPAGDTLWADQCDAGDSQ